VDGRRRIGELTTRAWLPFPSPGQARSRQAAELAGWCRLPLGRPTEGQRGGLAGLRLSLPATVPRARSSTTFRGQGEEAVEAAPHVLGAHPEHDPAHAGGPHDQGCTVQAGEVFGVGHLAAALVLMYRRAAISALVRPSPSGRRTSISRLLSWPTSLGPVRPATPRGRRNAAARSASCAAPRPSKVRRAWRASSTAVSGSVSARARANAR